MENTQTLAIRRYTEMEIAEYLVSCWSNQNIIMTDSERLKWTAAHLKPIIEQLRAFAEAHRYTSSREIRYEAGAAAVLARRLESLQGLKAVIRLAMEVL